MGTGLRARELRGYLKKPCPCKIQAGTHGEIEWGKVGDAWVPVKSYFRGEVKYMPGVRSFGDNRKRYYDFKLFTADSSFIPN